MGWFGHGRHPQGTLTRSIPLAPTCYIELLEAYDRTLPYGRVVTQALARHRPLLDFAIEVDDIDAVARRVGIAPERGTVELEDGVTGSWATVGREAGFPFFIRYARSHAERERANATRVSDARHTCAPTGIAWVEITGDVDQLREWIGPTTLDIRITDGDMGVRRFAIQTESGEIVVGA